jgi:hypothetical protein
MKENALCCCKRDSAVYAVIGALLFFAIVNKKNQQKKKSKPVPDPVNSQGGSLFFNYDDTDPSNLKYLSYSNAISFGIGNQPFTFEWFQFWQDGSSSFPRIFSVGTYLDPQVYFGVSYENTVYFWYYDLGTSTQEIVDLGLGSEPPKNEWVHVAIVGDGSSISLYFNGILQNSVSASYNIDNEVSVPLAIGNETIANDFANYKGFLTNFRFVNGTAVYTSNFTPPTSPLTVIPGTELLLLAETPDNFLLNLAAGNDGTNTGVLYSTSSPFV